MHIGAGWRSYASAVPESLVSGHQTDIPARMAAVAGARGWAWPGAAVSASVAAMAVVAFVHGAVDATIYRAGGAHALSGGLYDLVVYPFHLGFTYPPFAALVMAPAAVVSVRAFELVAALGNVSALVALIAVCLRACCPSWSTRTALWWAALLTVPVGLLDPVRESLLLGQVNVVLCALVLHDLTRVSDRRRGVLVGLAAAVKLTPLVFAVYLFLRGDRAAARRAGITFAGASLLAAAINPVASWRYWTNVAWQTRRTGSPLWLGNQGLVATIGRLSGHPLSAFAGFVVAGCVCAVGLAVAVAVARRRSTLLGLVVVAGTEALATPVSWTHHYVWVVLLVAWLALAPDRPRAGSWWAMAVGVFFWAAPFWWVPHGPGVRIAGHALSAVVANSGCLFLAGLIVIAGATVVRLRSVPGELLEAA